MAKIVKICGIKTVDAAAEAVRSGADLLGMIMVPGRARTIDTGVAQQITELIRKTRKSKNVRFQTVNEIIDQLQKEEFADFNQYSEKLTELVLENGPFSVGVFRNQKLDDVFELAKQVSLDCIQLHGSEDKVEYFEANDGLYLINPRYVIPQDNETMKIQFGQFHKYPGFGLPLLDSEAGGEGKVIDWSLINDLTFGNFILAGGLTPSNLAETAPLLNLLGYDVSGGVEDDQGVKDLQKIRDFIRIGKSL